MYATTPWFPTATVPGGTTVLVQGPPLVPKDDLVLRVLAGDEGPDAGTVFVTTTEPPDRLWKRYLDVADDAVAGRVGIVDATNHDGQQPQLQTGAPTAIRSDGAGTPGVVTVASPADLTGIGMGISDFLEEFWAETRVERVRVAVFSVDTMAMYADVDSIVRFGHAVADRVDAIDGLGFLVTHTDGRTDDVGSQLAPFADAVAGVENAEGDGRTVAVTFERGGDSQRTVVDLAGA